jgi:hypothetical protein
MSAARGVLLARQSAFQIYCANKLWRSGAIDSVIVEDGSSYASNRVTGSVRALARKISSGMRVLKSRPLDVVEHIGVLRNHELYFGNQEEHARRVFREGYERFDEGLSVQFVADVNGHDARRSLDELDPQIVFVFGTRIIKASVFEGRSAKFVNLHWGWSPDYRGEGIISALALGGTGALGVTIHRLSAGIDSGDILYRGRPVVDEADNFYSIGLKLTRIGVEFFIDCAQRVRRGDDLVGQAQEQVKGSFRGSRYLRENPSTYARAWRSLKNVESWSVAS